MTQEPRGFVEAIALIAGPLALLILLVDETDEAWADLYSCAVSIQNVFPRAPLRALVLGLGVACVAVALVLDVTRYETFLFLIGSVFVPLFGVLAADYFALRGRYTAADLLAVEAGVRWRGMVAWTLGIATYLWLAGQFEFVGLRGVPSVGASLPSLLVAGAAHLALARWLTRSAREAHAP